MERHLIDTSMFVDAMAADRQRLADLMAGPPPARLYPLPGLARDVLARASVVARDDPVAAVAVRALAFGLTGQVLACAARRRGEAAVEVPFGAGTATLAADQRLAEASSLTWRDAWYAAVVARDGRCLDALAGVDEADLEPGLAHGAAWMAALRAYRADPASAGPAVARAVAAGAPAAFQSPYQHRMHAPHVAVYPALTALADGDPAAFDAALLAALKAHKKYFGARSGSRDPNGWLALGPQALCRLAHDRGIAVTVESDYLLPALLAR